MNKHKQMCKNAHTHTHTHTHYTYTQTDTQRERDKQTNTHTHTHTHTHILVREYECLLKVTRHIPLFVSEKYVFFFLLF